MCMYRTLKCIYMYIRGGGAHIYENGGTEYEKLAKPHPCHTQSQATSWNKWTLIESLVVWWSSSSLFCFVFVFFWKSHKELGKQIHNQFSNYIFQTCGGNKLSLPPTNRIAPHPLVLPPMYNMYMYMYI